MANKSVLEIDVDDAQFKRFYEMFQEYQEHLGNMPDDWRKIDQAQKKAARSVKDVLTGSTAQIGSIATFSKQMQESLQKAVVAQKNFHRETRGSAKELKAMSGYAKSLGSHIFGIGKYLFKIGALGGGIGLLGGFGLRELGEGAVRRQAQARGIGLTPGQLKAWNTDLSRYLGVGAVHTVVGAQVDSSQWGGLLQALSGTGIGLTRALGMSPDRLTHRIALAAASRWNRESSAQRGVDPFLKAQASLLGGTEALRNLAAAQKGGEFSKGWAQYKRDAAKLNYSDKTANAWQSFVRNLSLAGGVIENVLIKRLGELAPDLGALVKSLSTDGAKLINDVLSPANINAMRGALDSFVSYLGGPGFKKDLAKSEVDIKQFLQGIADLAAGIEWITKLPIFHRKEGFAKLKKQEDQFVQSLTQPAGAPSAANRTSSGLIGSPSRHAFVSGLEQRNGLPPGTLWGLYGAESSYGKNAGYSSAGALGPYQWMAASAPEYGVKDRADFRQSAAGAARYFKQALAKYKGDLAKAVASYNWGYGNLDRDIQAHGKNWMAYAPKQTQREVSRVMKVIIENKAGSNVAVSANATAY